MRLDAALVAAAVKSAWDSCVGVRPAPGATYCTIESILGTVDVCLARLCRDGDRMTSLPDAYK